MTFQYIETEKLIRCHFQALILSWLLHTPLLESAQDVCNLSDVAVQNKELEMGAAKIASAYLTTLKPLSLKGGPCDWTCGSARIDTQFIKAFGFLQYNCKNTKAPPDTRLPTGSKTKSQMGLSITDKEYQNEANKIFRSGSSGVGDLMRVPPKLVNASKSGNVKKLTDAVSSIPGATWMKFSSTSVFNDGKGSDRVIIHVPDTKGQFRFDQWIQIAINKNTGKLGRNVDFIAIQHLSDTPSKMKLKAPVVVFRGYSRRRNGFELEGLPSKSQLSKCYSCHSGGLRAVIPAKEGSKLKNSIFAIKPTGTMLIGQTLEDQLHRIRKITSTRAVFGPKGYKAEESGPPLGPETWFDRVNLVTKGLPARPNRAAVTACAAGLTPDRQEAIIEHMDCASCHEPSDRGILNAGTSRETIKHKVVKNLEAPMPPGVLGDLNKRERGILFKCVKAEYAEILQDWLISDRLMPIK